MSSVSFFAAVLGPLAAAYNALKNARGYRSNKQMDEASIYRLWPSGPEGRWCIIRTGRDRRENICEEVLAAGTHDLKNLTAVTFVPSVEMQRQVTEALNYSNTLFECKVEVDEKMMRHAGGENRTREEVKGKGKGGAKSK